jgi:hypothetical protein
MNRLRGHERGQVLALATAPIEALMGSLAIVRSTGSRNFVGCAPRAAVTAVFAGES